MFNLKSSSLISTVTVFLIVAIVLLSLIQLAYYERIEITKRDVSERLDYQIEQSIRLLLSNNFHQKDTTVNMCLFDEASDSVMIKQHKWGLFTIAFIKAHYGHFEKSKSFLYGNRLPHYMNQSLYLADHKRSLFLVGQTKLVGDLTIPDAGIKPGYVNHKGFSFESLYQGKSSGSKPTLPSLDTLEVARLQNLVDLIDSTKRRVIQSKLVANSITAGFDEETYFYLSSDSISLRNILLAGNVVVVSNRHIAIDSSAILKDIIVIAPSVTIGKGFKGNLQVFATHSLILKDRVTLDYPSVLALIGLSTETRVTKVTIEEDVTITGIIMAIQGKQKNPPYVHIDNGFLLEGIYYCNGFSSLAGKVNGTVLVDYFIHESGNILYENYLVDVEINRQKMSDFFIGAPIFSSPGKKDIIQWFLQ
ncbi:hypothetical protein IQ13_0905 [Lacibacter cauensis]|uniref:Cytoskeletal protein CcmA (Bactofilin family) n=1 Tax=Lacibacter cauensis TaxID=510947 RepID=A0A562SYK7_9BACT|nr:hypothetical protein [Lacibacter cauensis]TWI85740.1 hypothetical protein IQ13_0905 [Lacibacter cauensis]